MSDPSERQADDLLRSIPTGPIEDEPRGAIEHDDRHQAFAAALDGIELGAHDRRIRDWLAIYEPSTVATICSWILRARAAAASEEPR